jgi:hypothetical protein
MKLKLDPPVSSLFSREKHWFKTARSPSDLINRIVSSSIVGIYCLWWKDIETFPIAKTVELSAGKRGLKAMELKRWHLEVVGSIAVYVGKGAIRTRLLSHVKAPKPGENGQQSRNPYQWVAMLFDETNPEDVIRTQLGFSFVEEPNKLEQVYAENLAIGVLRPWFNFRLTA